MLNSISLGLGLLLPLGNLSLVCPTGKEIRITCEVPTFPKLEFTNFKIITFAEEGLNINVLQLTEGAKIRLYKKMGLTIGVGGYYVRKTSGTGGESNYGSCSYIGVENAIQFSEGKTLIPEVSYYSVPQALSITLNIQLK